MILLAAVIAGLFVAAPSGQGGEASPWETDAFQRVDAIQRELSRHPSIAIQGFRVPRPSDLSAFLWQRPHRDWKTGVEEESIPFAVVADFNVDGQQDYAAILPREQGVGFAVVALVSDGKTHRLFILWRGSEASQKTKLQVLPEGSTHTVEGVFRFDVPGLYAVAFDGPARDVWELTRGSYRQAVFYWCASTQTFDSFHIDFEGKSAIPSPPPCSGRSRGSGDTLHRGEPPNNRLQRTKPGQAMELRR
jgi:hypothetical protein